jgi:MFS family permease
VIVRENFPLRMMGTIIGGTAMAGSLGMSTGPLLGGLLYDGSTLTPTPTSPPGAWAWPPA